MGIFKQTLKQAGRHSRTWMGGLALVSILALAACGAGATSDAAPAANASNSAEAGVATDASGNTTTTTGAENTTAGTNTAGSNTAGTGAAGTGTAGTGTTGNTGNASTTTTTTSATPAASATPTGTVSAEGYTITVYYTAVESFHTDAAQTVTGCLITSCSFGTSVIGSYPASFIRAAKTEGTGRITSGANAGKYLNWSVDVGYWLDTIASNGYGGALIPFQTAAADDIALTRGTQFKLVAPLMQEDGSALDSTSANRFLAAQWLVNDQFTPGLGGALHLDLYIGEEDRANFTSSPMYTTLANVKIARL